MREYIKNSGYIYIDQLYRNEIVEGFCRAGPEDAMVEFDGKSFFSTTTSHFNVATNYVLVEVYFLCCMVSFNFSQIPTSQSNQ